VVFGAEGIEVVPACRFEGAGAAPANRIQALLDQFPGRSNVTTICQTNLSDGLSFFYWGDPHYSDPCIYSSLLDLEPATPGLQPDCTGELHSKTGVMAMTPCAEDPEAAACWSIVDEHECPLGLRFAYRAPWTSAQQHVILQCLVE
ncbi:MAG: hypothetical protein H0T79_06980, partial [Deltaproteobacteria bacterium]|nr:hypothetical protein [Deltaproteobacteria bacterium]